MEGFVRPLVSTLAVLMLLPQTVWTQDPCAIPNPAVVPFLGQRGRDTVNIGLEDLLANQWFSGTDNYDMVITDDTEAEPTIDQCGSLYPAMIVGPNSTIPNDNTQQNVTARFYNTMSLTWETMILQVKDCGTYRMYQLQSIPMGTYCFEPNSNADLCIRNDIPHISNVLDRRPLFDAAILDDSTLTPGWVKSSLLDISQPFPVENPDFHHCGGAQPIYAENPLPPNDGMGHDMNLTIFNISGNNQSYVTIQVRNCGDFRIYNLSPMVPSNSSYCFDIPHSTDEFAPMVFPILTIDVYHECLNDTGRIVAVCEFEPEAENDTNVYLVTWFVSEMPLLKTSQVNAANLTMAIITDEDLVNEGYYRAVNANDMAFEVEPGEFHNVDILINTPLSCPCGEEFCNVKLFAVDPSVPVTPTDPSVEMAFVSVENAPNGESGVSDGVLVEGAGSAPARRRRSFSPSGDPFRLSFRIKHSFPYRTKHYITRKSIPIMLRMTSDRNAFWPNGIFGSVNVRVRERSHRQHWRRKSCHAFCDPHMRSFDGRSYELQTDGEYVLYKYCPKLYPRWYSNPSVSLKVHVKISSCRGDGHVPFCPCGIAVMAGHDIYVVDTCEDSRYQGFTRCEDNILRVEETDTVVKVWLPHGTRVEARKGQVKESVSLWNVWVYPSIYDVDSSCGLCGTLDDNCANDCDVFNCNTFYRPYGSDCNSRVHALEFTEQFRVPSSQSLFPPLEFGNIVYINPTPFRPNSPSYCFCGHRQWPRDSSSCSCQQTQWWGDVRDQSCDVFLEIPENPSERIIDRQDEVNRETQPDCETMMADLREEFPECPSFNDQLENCKEDLILDPNALDEGTDWVENSRQILATACQIDNAAQMDPVPAIMNMCPVDCGNHGHCVEGACVCDSGYGNSLCDTSFKDKVDVLSVENGLCDRRRKPCTVFDLKPRRRAFVREFDYIANIDVREITKTGSVKKFGRGFKKRGIRRNFLSLEVEMPLIKPTRGRKFRYRAGSRSKRSANKEIDNDIEAAEDRFRRQTDTEPLVEGLESFALVYDITLTTDNVTFSDPVSAYNFDATCIGYVDNESGDVNFFIKPLFCFLDFECVPNGTYHITDDCKFCHTERNPISWTDDLNNAECIEAEISDQSDRPLSIAVIASSSAAVLVVLTAAAIFIIYRIYRKTLPKNATFAEIGHTLGQKNPHFQPKEFLPEKKRII
ncbi:uncharacterized protein LOC132554163 [Ylistrum balloti]|uniref:uncharacterized protein LOC132554163 n=1 Tax=Ylistrum balloti TaxID=509963 RepID=UPI002905E1B6|nr:uncharacterized protein LOC132554163 [Ylistrum balloti]